MKPKGVSRNKAVIITAVATILMGSGWVVYGDSGDRIRPYEQNRRFWQYEGEPVMLLGGSKDDNLFQVSDLEAHLDEMVEVGANYIRNTMSSRDRDDGNVRAFKRLENGKFDLDQWNSGYWERFERMLELTAEREIFVQIELWDQWDHNGDNWDTDPWNPDRNVNYTASETTLGGSDHYGGVRHNSETKHDLFLTVPALNHDQIVLLYQERFIDKILSYSLE